MINQPCSQHGCPDSVVVITPDCDQGDVSSNPAQGNYSFPQKLSSVEIPVTFYMIYIYIYIYIYIT